MPYVARKRGDKWVTINKDTGKIKGTHSSHAKAQRQANLLNGIEHEWKPTRRR